MYDVPMTGLLPGWVAARLGDGPLYEIIIRCIYGWVPDRVMIEAFSVAGCSCRHHMLPEMGTGYRMLSEHSIRPTARYVTLSHCHMTYIGILRYQNSSLSPPSWQWEQMVAMRAIKRI